jgi:hypothetical protein
MKKQLLLIVLAVFSLSLPAQVTNPYIIDFENHNTGTYTLQMAKTDFPGASWYHGMDQGRSEIVEDGESKVLRVKYPQGCVGPNDSPIGCGIQVKWNLPETSDTMWVSYRIKFEEGFEFIKGGKLPGLCGGKCYTGGITPAQGDGWSARIMWRTGGKVVQYMYFTDQKAMYGDDMPWDEGDPQRTFIPGQWHKVTTQVILNTIPAGTTTGSKNGIVRSWFDGKLALEVDTLRLVDFPDQKIDIFYISTFHGGDNSTWAPTNDSYIRYDDFVISKAALENVDGEDPVNNDLVWTNPENGQLTAYPNPVVDELHINSDKEVKAVQVFSLLGNPIVNSSDNIIPVGDYLPGVYFLLVTFEDGSISKTKFLKL